MVIRIRRLLAALTAAACGLWATGAAAQMGYSPASIEWLSAQSDGVMRGVITNVAAGEEHQGRAWSIVALDVRETLKGPGTKRVHFASSTSRPQLQQWQESGTEVLWLLHRRSLALADAGGEAGEPPRSLLSRTPWFARCVEYPAVIPLSEAVRDDPQPPPLFTTDLTLLRAPAEILRAARTAAAREPRRGPARPHRLALPREIAQRTGRSGDVNTFTVPIDGRLEAFARRLIRKPEAFLRKGEEPYRDLLRYEGIRALRHFRSWSNIVLLRPLLRDRAWRIEHRGDPASGQRVYFIREAAHAALQGWGIARSKPVLREGV